MDCLCDFLRALQNRDGKGGRISSQRPCGHTSKAPVLDRYSSCKSFFHFPLLFVAKKELFRFPGIRSYLSLVGGIPLDRDRCIRTFNAVKFLLFSLKAEEKVVIFPEGTYVRDAVGSGKNRLIRMILGIQSELKERIPFIPVGIRYGERSGWRRRVDIRIGPPLFGEGEPEALSLTRRIMEEISRLSGLPLLKERHESGDQSSESEPGYSEIRT